jgi:hypothetical protein
MKNFFLYAGWVTSALFCILFIENSSETVHAVQKADTLRTAITLTLPELIAQGKALRDSSKQREKRDSVKKITQQHKADTGTNALTKLDTVNINLRKLVANNKRDYQADILKKKDSIDVLKVENRSLAANNLSLKKGMQNIVFSNYSPALALNPDTLNASIYAKPFKKSTNQSIFSPQKNFLRIYNQRPGGTVNDLPYFDYEQTNDEIYALLFQGRASQNITTGQFSIGGGLELKLNRTGINAAVLFNPFTGRRPTITVGLREDFYRIRLNK